MSSSKKLKGHTYQAQVHASTRGFQYTLENGYRLSVMFDHGNYCDNQDNLITDGVISSPNFEVAVFDPDGKFITLIDEPEDEDGIRRVEQVIGWVPAKVLPNLIQRIMFFPDHHLDLPKQKRDYALAFGKFCENARDADRGNHSVTPGPLSPEQWDEIDNIASNLDIG